MRLVYDEAPNTEVEIGDTVVIDGDSYVVAQIVKPHKPSSTGRVRVVDTVFANTSEYFPSVIRAHWIEREDHA